MHVKQLKVEYVYNGKPQVMAVEEGDTIEIPVNDMQVIPPTYNLMVADTGAVSLKAWEAGKFDLTTALGKHFSTEAPALEKPVEITGPWTVNFPKGWGTPEQITLDNLISWTEHPESGVKYFSGTAIYIKEIDIPAALLGEGKLLALDLSRVKNIAEVKLNGQDLGIWWKPPFRADITKFAKPGKNSLEVRITNLWPNRLIGDEQLPDDREWDGKQLKGWPQWLLEGKPSPTGRLTFTTWHHWTKEDKLLESGLLGPVRLVPGLVIPLEIPD